MQRPSRLRMFCFGQGTFTSVRLTGADRPAYVFLASNADASYITGEVIALLGGDTIAG